MSETRNAMARPVKARRWTGLVGAGVAVGIAVGGAAQGATALAGGVAAAPERLWLAAGTEGGEGGEGGAAPIAADATVDLLVALTKIEAHALTGLDLVAAGQAKAGAEQVHAAHEEIFEAIEAALVERKAPLFEADLRALTSALEAGKDASALTAAHDGLKTGLEAARVVIAPTAHEELAAVLALTREAAEDFGAGVKDQKIVELGEYQDARAYLLAANETLARLSSSADTKVQTAAKSAAAALAPVMAGLADVAPTGAITMDTATILSAAARIELASYPVK